MKKTLIIGVVALTAATTGIATIAPFHPGERIAHAFQAPDTAKLADPAFYAGLSVASVAKDGNKGDWGTVILIPQIHQGPGSDPGDGSNDQAAVAQQQIYDIARRTQEQHVDTFMMEGEASGDVSKQKVEAVSKKMAERRAFADDISKLTDRMGMADPSERDSVKSQADQALQTADRTVLLTGAILKLKAEQPKLNLLGVEKPSTQESSRTIVRDRLYLQDRLSQLDGTQSGSQTASTAAANTTFAGGSNTTQLLSLLSRPSLDSTLQNVATRSNDPAVDDGVQNARQALKELRAPIESPESGPMPSRSDNPYADVTDRTELQQKLDENNQKLQQVIIDQRNRETAEEVASGLRSHDRKVGVLQFGAGHGDALVQALRSQGLTVITVMPQGVADGLKQK